MISTLHNKKKIISVIVPVYNTAKYLNRCLDSICNQTYKYLEIICIDDGSNDGSEKIVDEFAYKDKRLKILHQSNHGESHARNMGLRMATGEYITFVDCDDYLERTMYQQMADAIEKYNVDMVACRYFKNDIPVTNDLPITDKVITDREKLLVYVYQRDAYRGFSGYIWCKLFRNQILLNRQNEKIMFDERIHLGGDILYFAQIALNTNTTLYIDKPLYHYVQRDTSATHSQDETKWQDIVLTYLKVIDLFKKSNIPETTLIWVKRFLVYRCELIAIMAYKHKNVTTLRFCQHYMKLYENEYLSTNNQYEDRIKLYHEIMSYSLSGSVNNR